jgi:hypothetical protein
MNNVIVVTNNEGRTDFINLDTIVSVTVYPEEKTVIAGDFEYIVDADDLEGISQATYNAVVTKLNIWAGV